MLRHGRVSVLGGWGGWHKASVSDRLPLAAPISLSPLLILTLCGPERVLVVCCGGGRVTFKTGCNKRFPAAEKRFCPSESPPRRRP